MRRLRNLALRVVDESASGQDVTDEYVDLQSRLGVGDEHGIGQRGHKAVAGQRRVRRQTPHLFSKRRREQQPPGRHWFFVLSFQSFPGQAVRRADDDRPRPAQQHRQALLLHPLAPPMSGSR